MASENLISSSPQIHSGSSTTKIMGWVIVAMIPAAIWSIAAFGFNALLVILLSTIAAVFTEFALNTLFRRKNTLGDLSAVVTGILVGFNMPPEIPLFVPVIASVFAIAVVKWSFGGLGSNWMNPALAGRVFVFFSWGKAMTHWTAPGFNSFNVPDTLSTATPLGLVKVALNVAEGGAEGPMRLLETLGMPLRYVDLFLGRMPGSVGEISSLLLILGGILLLCLRIVKWEIPVTYIGSFALLIWVFDGVHYSQGFFAGDVLFHLFTGGLMLGAWFMATDMVSTPLTRKGQILFGFGCGFLSFVIRVYGNFPEGVSLAIILMNILTPLFDRYTAPKRYGISL